MTETLLLDENVLIALSFTDHLHHRLATDWFATHSPRFATCPITQGALVRFSLRHYPNEPGTAKRLLEAVVSMERHEFWPDSLSCTSLPWRQIFGHRQVTDAYLVSLAKHHSGRLATLDAAMATVFPEALLVTQ
jgi:hypothetical protein